MKALSIRSPWWWFILHAGKDIENRDWYTNYRGTVYVHASKWWRKEEVIDDAETAIHCYNQSSHPKCNKEMSWDVMRSLGGHIVGKVDIVGCANRSDSPWFFGKYGLV